MILIGFIFRNSHTQLLYRITVLRKVKKNSQEICVIVSSLTKMQIIDLQFTTRRGKIIILSRKQDVAYVKTVKSCKPLTIFAINSIQMFIRVMNSPLERVSSQMFCKEGSEFFPKCCFLEMFFENNIHKIYVSKLKKKYLLK